MQRLTGLDEMYLALDTPRTTGHVAGVAVFEPGEARGEAPGAAGSDNRLEFLRNRVAERLPVLDLLRWTLQSVPLGLDQRHWVETGEVDLTHHVVGVTVPLPGTDEQFHEVVDEIMTEHLPRDRPMWRIYLVEGLSGGRFAYVVKITHGLTDGSALWAIYDLLSDDPVEKATPRPAQVLSGRRRQVELVKRGVAGLVAKPVEFVRLQGDLMTWAKGQVDQEGWATLPRTALRVLPGSLPAPIAKALRKVAGADADEIDPLMPTMSPPASPFNGAVTTNLGITTADLGITDLRTIGKKVGGTINDAVLAVVAGGLRAYMADHGTVPDEPLVGSAPISWRTGEEVDRWANHVWMLFLPLPTHLADPIARLRFAHDAATRAKTTWDHMPSHLMRRAAALIPSAVMAPGARIMTALPIGLVPRMYNVAVSNVKGPRVPPTYDGVQMKEYFLYGFLTPGCGILVGGMSLGDRMLLSTTACRDIVPDYRRLPDYFQASLQELLAAPTPS